MKKRDWIWIVVLTATLSGCGRDEPAPPDRATSTVEPTPLPTRTAVPTIEQEPAILIEPQSALSDQELVVRIVGLEPGQMVTLRASMRDGQSRLWESEAGFVADEAGRVNVPSQAPIEGSYSSADPMGLFWSMEPAGPGLEGWFSRNRGSDTLVVTFTAESDGEEIAVAYHTRVMVDPKVMVSAVSENGLVGFFHQPPAEDPVPALLVLSGSDGGVDGSKASLLASHGYATLALDYFGNPPLPETLNEIPLEYFKTAIDWLRAQAGVDGDRIGVVGSSRGGELALLLGATFPELTAVVGYVASGVVTGGFPVPETGVKPAWTYNGEPVPFAEKPEYAEDAAIAVEKINGPVLLISGADDQLWPSAELSEIAVTRLREHNHPFPFEHIIYEDAGHFIGLPYWPTTASTIVHPVTRETFAVGGTAVGYGFAAADSWGRVLEFLGRYLGE